MDPESSDSDISAIQSDGYRYGSPPARPAALPQPASKYALESSDAVQARLRELDRIFDHNNKKQNQLQLKRRRKDERISRKREVQDKKWTTITEARTRHDTKIKTRRDREDAAFSKVFDDLEDEEKNLRHRLRRLKRGLQLTSHLSQELEASHQHQCRQQAPHSLPSTLHQNVIKLAARTE